ncbi:MAG: fibronectin type III domain-containing protein [Bacteroidales bacterium]|nr:fibronectin type III domain-containing protein [Bacteroidales bacterium]
MKKILFLLLAAIMSLSQLLAQTVPITIGTGTTTTQAVPFYHNYDYSHAQMLYLSSELVAGQVDSISFYYDLTTPKTMSSATVYLGEVSRDRMARYGYVPADSLTVVYQGSLSFSEGWVTIHFTTPFTYSGVGNLVVGFTNGHGEYTDLSGSKFRCTATSDTLSVVGYRDNTAVSVSNVSTATYQYAYAYRPNIIFHLLPDGEYCNPVEGLAVSDITTNSASLSWTSDVSNFEYEYKPTSDSWTSENVVSGTLTTPNISLSDLLPGTNYDFRVKNICSSGESFYTTISFQTICDVYQVPFEDGFEGGFDFTFAAGFIASPLCWANINPAADSYKWQTSTTYHSGAKSAYYYGSTYSTTTSQDWLITPQVNLSGNERMHFYVKKSGASNPIGINIYAYDASSEDISSAADVASFVLIDSVPSAALTTTDWYEYELNLSDLGGTYRFALVPYAGAGGLYVDDFSITELPECIRPVMSSVASSEITANEATISWSDENNSQWIVYYKPISATEWVSETASSTEVTLTDLIPGTLYNAYVVAVCGDEESDPTYTISFVTLCDVISEFPWIEGFESTWNSQNLMSNTIAAPFCWYNINAGGSTYYWKTTSTAYEGSNAAYMYGYSGSSTSSSYKNDDWFITPVFELTGSEVLSFYTKKSSSSYTPELRIYAFSLENGDISSAADTASFFAIDSLADLTADYAEREVSLESLVGQYRLAFVRNKTYANGSVYIDNVSVKAAAPCQRPSDLVVSGRTDSEISVSWTEVEGASSYNVYYRTDDDEPWTTVNVASNEYTITELTSATEYTIDVTAICSEGTETGFTFAPSVVTATLCSPYPVPFTEDFTTFPSTSGVTACWAKAQGFLYDLPAVPLSYGSSSWGSQTKEGILLGSQHAKINIYKFSATGSDKKEWLITPTIDLGDGSTEYDLKFSLAFTKCNSTDAPVGCVGQKFMALVSPDGGATWDSIDALTWEPAFEGQTTNDLSSVSTSGQIAKVNLTELGYTGNVRIGFYAYQTQYVAGQDNDLHIDDVQIIEHVECPDLLTMDVNAVTTSSVALDWDNTVDTGDGWTVLYTEGTTITPETEDVQTVSVPNGTELPYVLEGLTSGATYSFIVSYDCGGAWTTPATITVPASAASLPYTCDFEDQEENASWTLINGTAATKWFIGAETATPENNKLYVSSDNGATLSYEVSGVKTLYAIRNITFGDAPLYRITFDYKGGGESTYDFVKVGLWGMNQTFEAGTTLPSWLAATAVQPGFTYTGGVTKFNKTEGEVLQGEIYVDGAEVNNTIKQLVFAWRQDGGTGDAIGVQIDNISIIPINCATPASFELAEGGRGTNSLTFDIEDENGSEWEIQYKEYDADEWQSFFTTNLTGNTINDLTSGTMYKIRLRAVCGEDSSMFIPTTGNGYVLYSTECETITVTEDAPFVENFEGSAWFRSGNITSGDVYAPVCWLNINGKNPYYKWNRGTGAANSYNGSAGHLYMYNLTSVSADTTSDWFITPIFDLAGTETLSFFAKKGTVDETLKIMYYSVDENGDMTSRADTANFQHLQTITINSSTYAPYDVQLSDLVGQYRLAFYASAPGNYMRIDDVMVHIPNCSRPQADDLSVVAAATTATVTITDESNSAWIIYYKAESESDYTAVPTTSQETQLTDLTATTTYNIYIVGDCGATQSAPSSSKTFRTRCFDEAISEFPYTEGFESGLDCWDVTYTSTNTNTYQWTAVTTGTSPTCTPHGGANMAKYQSFNASAGSTSTMISPLMDFPQNMTMKFWMYRTTSYASNNDHVEVYVNSLPTTEGATLLTTVQLNGPAAAWEEQEVQITEDNVGEQYIIFKAISGYGGNIYIDDITIDAASNCTRPDAASVAASAITANTATISWTDNNDDHFAWNVYYRVVGSEEDYSVAPASEQTVELTDLDPMSTYEVYVTTDCGSEESDATYSINFTTSCVTVVDFPYFEGFENGLTCWSIVNITGSEQWTQSNGSNMSSNSGIAPMTDGGGQYFAETHGTTRGNVNRFISPIFDISMLDTPVLSFYHLQKAWVSDIDNLKVYYKADLSDDWTQIANYTEGISTWRRDTIILPNPSETYQLAFEANLDYGYGVCIDNVSIYESAGEQPEPCDAPTALTVSNITQTSADFSWNGTATSYEVRLNENAAETVTTTSTSFTDLTANTTYTAYVRAVCENDNSEWVSTTFTTLEAEPVIVPPTVATLAATGVTHNSATLNGTITAGSEAITAQGFMYKATAAADWTSVSASGTTLVATVNTLAAETEYQFKAFATTASGTVEGAVMTFTTTATPVIVPPTVTTLAATSVTHESATLNGTITAGDETITAQGFMYKATAAADWTTVAATGTTITSTLNSLAAETEYQFKAFATTASGTVEGAAMTFTTTAAPVTQPAVATLPATGVTHEVATLNGTVTTGSEAISAQGFMYKATTAADWTTVAATGETMSATINGLTAETAYEYKAFATTASGTVEGVVVNFTTLAAPATQPTVVTLEATEITHEAATLNGTVAAGTEAITAQGFMYKAITAADWTTVAAEGTANTATINGLTPETEYEYKAFATTASGTVEGNVVLFTTLANSGLNSAEGAVATMTVYPNPASERAIVAVSGVESGAKIVVSDMQGRIILTDTMAADTYELSVENLASGVYYIRVIDGASIHTQKLIVK